MCGIVGYVGKKPSLPILLDSLRRLEYRGYDSAGITFQNGNGIEIYKTKGKIKSLEGILPEPYPNANIGLGHTRWATHGEPSTKNAHPHVCEGVVVVHNGIIENHSELKRMLLSKGHVFSSDTDTEVIPQIISMYLKQGNSIEEAITMAASALIGSYAIGIMSESSPDTLYAIKHGSPLVLGLGKDEFFFASDIPAILPYTNRFVFLEDGYFCTVTAEGIEMENMKSKNPVEIDKNVVTVDWSPSMAEKDGYDYFMLKEIYEQPRAVFDTLRGWIDNPLQVLDDLGLHTANVVGLRKIHIVACGTSYHAGMIGRYVIESISRIPMMAEIASEYRYMRPIIENGCSLFVSITQSGETADTIAAQREAKQRGARTLSICNVVGSTASREADAVLYTRAGPEIGVASTKTFTSQLAALCMLAIGLGIRSGRLGSREAESLRSSLSHIPSLIEKGLRKDDEIRDIAKSLVHKNGFLYLGRGVSYPIALEGALKLKEISYIHTEGYPAGEMKHGPIALVSDDTPVVVVVPVDDLYTKTISNVEEIKARGGRIIAITDESACLKDIADDIIEVPSTHQLLSPFVSVIPLQLLAYHIGVLRGCNVDKPRNLAKSVTVE